MKLIYDKVKKPIRHTDYLPVNLTKETMEEHRRKVLQKMEELKLDILLIYADREHGANFDYLTGWVPGFEEAVLVMHLNGECFMMLGNEMLEMCGYSRIEAKAIHVPLFSAASQPMETDKTLRELFADAGIVNGKRIGCAGWKYFTSRPDSNEEFFDVPAFLVDTIRKMNPDGQIVYASPLFNHPDTGVRICMNANEIAHYEYGAGLASACVLDALEAVEPGKTELEIGDYLHAHGQLPVCTPGCYTGTRHTDAAIYPRNKKIQMGDEFAVSHNLRGGLTYRAAYIARSEEDLPENVRDYIEKAVIPYYRAEVTWYEMVGIGVTGGEVYDKIEEIFPKADYHWALNPGHHIGSEEWVSSPFFQGSEVVLRSGMLIQMDILPFVPGYGRAHAEDGVAIADEKTREELKAVYPDTWKRIEERRRYMKEELGIELKEEVLPLSDICAYVRPYLLNRDCAMKKVVES